MKSMPLLMTVAISAIPAADNSAPKDSAPKDMETLKDLTKAEREGILISIDAISLNKNLAKFRGGANAGKVR